MPDQIACEGCGEAFSAVNPNQRYCTTKCRRRTYGRDTPCLECGAIFKANDHRAVYCSRSCSVKHANRISPKRRRAVLSQCPCGLVVRDARRKFCSRACFQAARQDEKTRDWVAGRTSLSSSDGTLAGAGRRFLVARAGDRCERCGWGESNPTIGRPILTVDHIDGNWRNNYIANLIVLCFNCHTLTPTFGALNKGRFDNGARPKGSRIAAPLIA